MSGDRDAPGGVERSEGREEARAERLSYLIGFGLATVLSGIPFALVAAGAFGRTATLWAIGLAALAQVVVHFRFFLHIDFSRQKREDLQLILFTALILLLMCGGTLWILFDLHARMGPGTAP